MEQQSAHRPPPSDRWRRPARIPERLALVWGRLERPPAFRRQRPDRMEPRIITWAARLPMAKRSSRGQANPISRRPIRGFSHWRHPHRPHRCERSGLACSSLRGPTRGRRPPVRLRRLRRLRHPPGRILAQPGSHVWVGCRSTISPAPHRRLGTVRSQDRHFPLAIQPRPARRARFAATVNRIPEDALPPPPAIPLQSTLASPQAAKDPAPAP